MNYYEEYFTTESLVANNTITLTIGSAVTTQCITYIAYSKDKTNWTSVTPTSGTDTISVTLNANEKAYWKGDALSLARSYGDNSNQSIFSSTGNYKVYGNIASLLYADNFTGQFYFPSASSYWNYRNFQKLFNNSTYLVDAKGLIFPFKKYENNCCANMFEKCPIVNAPQMKLDNTNHGNYALENMFRDCTSLVDASSIEINGSINMNGIDQMFRGCSSLTKAAKIGAITTAGSASLQLFYRGCTNLNYIINLDPNPDSSKYTNWVYGVSASGNFIKHPDATWESGVNGIPNGWTVKNMNPTTVNIDYNKIAAAYVRGNHSLSAIYGKGGVLLWGTAPIDYNKTYLTFKILTDGTITYNKASSSATGKTIYYRKNNGSWTSISLSGLSTSSTINVVTGDIVEFYGSNSKYGENNTDNYCYFGGTASYDMYGNIRSLQGGENFMNSSLPWALENYALYSFFKSCNIVDASNLIFDISSYGQESCSNMFYECSSMVACTKILSGTSLGVGCFAKMFEYCTSLVKAPELPATTLNYSSYELMFYGCSSLNYIKAMFTTKPGTLYTANWVAHVSSSGTYIKNSSASYTTRGFSFIPADWTVETADA